eukprot:440323-Rhodomonas_salina.4
MEAKREADRVKALTNAVRFTRLRTKPQTCDELSCPRGGRPPPAGATFPPLAPCAGLFGAAAFCRSPSNSKLAFPAPPSSGKPVSGPDIGCRRR